MMTARRLSFTIAIAVMLTPFAAAGDDVADVLAADDRIVELFNAMNADELESRLVENFVSYGGFSPILTDGRAAFLQGVRGGPSIFESSRVAPAEERRVRINGNTAIVAATWVQTWKPVDGPWMTTFFHNMSTFVKVGGQWKLAMNMTRPIPSGNQP